MQFRELNEAQILAFAITAEEADDSVRVDRGPGAP
jgi:hypothetical protein